MNRCSYFIESKNRKCKKNKFGNNNFCIQHCRIIEKLPEGKYEPKKNKKEIEKCNEIIDDDDCESKVIFNGKCEKHADRCTICLDAKKYPLITLSCDPNHSFHEGCLLTWTKENMVCPMCRAYIVTYTVRKTKDSKPEIRDFKKELYDKYLPHFSSLTTSLNTLVMTLNCNFILSVNDKANMLYGFIKSIYQYMLGEGKYVITYKPELKKNTVEKCNSLIEYCGGACPEYYPELIELNQKVVNLT